MGEDFCPKRSALVRRIIPPALSEQPQDTTEAPLGCLLVRALRLWGPLELLHGCTLQGPDGGLLPFQCTGGGVVKSPHPASHHIDHTRAADIMEADCGWPNYADSARNRPGEYPPPGRDGLVPIAPEEGSPERVARAPRGAWRFR